MIRPEFFSQRFPLWSTIKPANQKSPVVQWQSFAGGEKDCLFEISYTTPHLLNKVRFCSLSGDIKLKYPHDLPSGEHTCSNEALFRMVLFCC